jgi:hypothetical protein
MSDMKSKLPNFEEVTQIAGKLFRDLKNSVSEIMTDYKKKRDHTAAPSESEITSSDPTIMDKVPPVEKKKTAKTGTTKAHPESHTIINESIKPKKEEPLKPNTPNIPSDDDIDKK